MEDIAKTYYRVSIRTEEVCGTVAYCHYFTDAADFAERTLEIYASCFDTVEVTISINGNTIRTYRKES